METTLAYAQAQDAQDSLKKFRNQFHIPRDSSGRELVYLCGNSLGLQPKLVQTYLQQELDDWAQLGVDGHTDARHPWMPYHEFLTEQMAQIVGAKPSEVVVMNTLTTNLHLLLVSFYSPTAKKFKILIEKDAFPSDKYAVESQLRFHGIDPKEGLVLWSPRQNEYYDTDDLEQILKEQGDQIALLLLGTPNYYTGQVFPIQKITQLGHQYHCLVGFDLAHGAGNINPNLHHNGPDFAVWCTYKYLNSGPGSLGGLFVHERHAYRTDLKRFTGWWGHNKNTRFNMRQEFDLLPGAEGWQLSNPPILSMAAIRASLEVFHQAGMENLQAKSKKLTAYMEFLLQQLPHDRIRIITPSHPEERGCQLSLAVKNADKSLYHQLTQNGVVSDWREPDVIRVAPVPLYNSFEDVWQFVQRLQALLDQ